MLLEIQHIHKSFGEVEVLKGINLKLASGQVLGIVGENGAGKSTLMNILGGLFPPTHGHMKLSGQPYEPVSPKDAQQAGISFIHQELNLFPNLSVTENLLLNRLPKKKILGISFLDHKQAKKKANQLLKAVGLTIDPSVLLEQLTPAQQQLVEIARALSFHPRIIILDEPTTSLTRYEAENLFKLISRLKADGVGMIYISHNLEDVMKLADAITILRDGEQVGQIEKEAIYRKEDIVKKMVGREMNQLFPSRSKSANSHILLKAEHLKAGNKIQQISFEVKQQEILGLYGLVGAGRTEMARIIYGLDYFESGNIYWKGQLIKHPRPKDWIKRKVGFLTEDRRTEGLLLSQNIIQNIQLPVLPRFTQRPLQRLDFSGIQAAAHEQALATNIKFQSLSKQAVSTLSGGNQQKVVLAKWLTLQPELLILDEPTRGIDIGAKYEIYTLIHQLVAAGAGILFISSEIDELTGMCDRILVMSQGKITAQFKEDQFDRSAILAAALHAKSSSPSSN